MQNKQDTILTAIIAGDIELKAGQALERLRRALLSKLTFSNPSWQKQMKRGVSVEKTPRQRYAFQKLKDGGVRISRGAWKILLEIAKKHEIEIKWEVNVTTPEERPLALELNAELRPYQQDAIDASIKSRGGVIVIPTGGGKTMVAMGLAAQLKTETLFIVHTRELLRQTVQSVAQFLGIEAGVIGAGKWEPKPFTVALIQTLVRRDIEEIKDHFGLIVIDEAHHAPAQSYFDVLPYFSARYRVALTATPYRKDGLHELLWLQFGDIVYRVHKKDLEEHGRLLTPIVYPITTNFQYDYNDDFTSLITALCENPKRHEIVIDTIKYTHRPRGCSLILTERIEHCRKITKSLQKEHLPVVMLHGQLSSKVRIASLESLKNGEAELLVATLSLIGEGWDHPPLETLYLTVPNGNKTKTTQALGRILRPAPNKPTPRVYDFVDRNVGLLRYHWGIRGKVYGLTPEECQSISQPSPTSEKEDILAPPKQELMDMLQAISQGDFDAANSMLQKNKLNNKK